MNKKKLRDFAINACKEDKPADTYFDPRIWLLSLGIFAIGTDVFVVSGILSTMANELAIGLEDAGLTVTAYAVTYALAAPLIVPLIDTLDQGRVVMVTLLLFALANALCALAPNYGVLMAARIGAGLAAALYTSTAYALATAMAPTHRRGAALSAVALGLTASAVFGVPIGAAIGAAIGWRWTFWLVTALSVLAVLALALRAPRTQRTAAAHTVTAYAERFVPLAQPKVFFALLPSLLWNTANLTSYTYLGAMLAQTHAPQTIVLLLFTYGVGGLIGSQLGGRLVDRFGATAPLAICLALATLNQSLMGASSQHTVSTALALGIWSISGWATFAPQQARLIALAPKYSALLIALNHSVIYIGFAAGAALGGAALSHGLAMANLHWITAGLLALALLTFLWDAQRSSH